MKGKRSGKFSNPLHDALLNAGWVWLSDAPPKPQRPPCARPRSSRLAHRRTCSRRRTAPKSGADPPDGEGDAEALLADVDEAGGFDPLDLNRAAFLVLRDGWTHDRWHAALDAAIDSGRCFTFDDGEEVWIVRTAR